MIKGLTHDNNGVANMVIKYRGKISTGYGPNEGPNKRNAPVAAGFFRMLKEQTTTKRVGTTQETVVIKNWFLNKPIQNVLEKKCENELPRRIELVSLYRTQQEIWESCLAMYSSSDGLLCKSHGEGENARFLTYDSDGERVWVDREFDGMKSCPYKKCPDFIAKKCKEIGLMKCFPVIDLTPNPYRFETRSINTIIGIESSFNQLWNLLRVAHSVKEREAGKPLQFDGFFGAKLYLDHKKIKSGGRDIFISEILPTQNFISLIMEPIKRGLRFKVTQAALPGSNDAVSMLEHAGQQLLERNHSDEPVPLNLQEQKDIATNFVADADKDTNVEKEDDTEDVLQKASEILLDGKGK